MEPNKESFMKQRIWDLPTRIFHWAFAVSVLGAFAVGKLVSDESPLFNLHFAFGIAAGVLLVWRILWGLLGSKHARFAAMMFSWAETKDYFASVLKGRGRYYTGHNPGGALAVWGMLGLTALTVLSGLLMGRTEALEEVHEILPIVLMVVVVAHVAGVLLATFMHRENYTLSMINGFKSGESRDAIPRAYRGAAAALVAFFAAGMLYFGSGYDAQARSLYLAGLGTTLQIGEAEEHEPQSEAVSQNDRDDDEKGEAGDDDGDDDDDEDEDD
jgi:cytochrome b